MAAPSAESLPDALPPRVAALFWEYEPRCLDPDRHRGRSVRLWQVVLDLPADQVEAWLATPERAVWDHRTRG